MSVFNGLVHNAREGASDDSDHRSAKSTAEGAPDKRNEYRHDRDKQRPYHGVKRHYHAERG